MLKALKIAISATTLLPKSIAERIAKRTLLSTLNQYWIVASKPEHVTFDVAKRSTTEHACLLIWACKSI